MNSQEEAYVLPRALAEAPPRPVSRRQRGRFGCAGILFVMPQTLIGCSLLLVFVITAAEVYVGHSYPGTVVSTKSTKGKKSTTYYATYTYETQEGIQKSERTISGQQYGRLSDLLGQPSGTSPPQVEVRAINLMGSYFDEAFLPEEKRHGPVIFWLAWAIGWNLLVAGPFWYGIWLVRRERRLYRRGTPVIGRIVKKRHEPGAKYFLDYEFDHPGLGVRTATEKIAFHGRWKEIRGGQSVTVLCYRNRKRPTAIYECGDYECR